MSSDDKRGFPAGAEDLERSSVYYDKLYANAEHLDRAWNARRDRTHVWYPALLLAEPPILDVGCGAGQLAEMCDVFGVPYAMGFDSSAQAIKLAERRVPLARFVAASGESAKQFFKRQDYHTAVFCEVLEHVYADLQLIRQVPRGRVVVGSVPNFCTEGHVRWFRTATEVRIRYAHVLKIERIITEPAAQGPNQWFIFKGVRP